MNLVSLDTKTNVCRMYFMQPNLARQKLFHEKFNESPDAQQIEHLRSNPTGFVRMMSEQVVVASLEQSVDSPPVVAA